MKKRRPLFWKNLLPDPWLLALRVSVACVLLPFAFLAVRAAAPANENWRHIQEWALKSCLWDTALVTFLGTAGASLIGVPLAWITCLFSFPGKSVLEWALVLPLAIPPYIAAYVIYHLTGYTGGIQVGLRLLGVNVSRLSAAAPPLVFAVFVFAVTLFPYVYLIVKAFLKKQSASLYENARLLGCGTWGAFFRVFLPLMVPSIMGGAALTALEILSDFGVTSHFGLHTFTTAIFGAWFGMSDADSAAKLSVMLLGGVFTVMVVNKLAQRGQKYHAASSRERALQPQALRSGLACTCFCVLVLFFSLLFPVGQLLYWLTLSWNPQTLPRLWENAWNTISGGLTAATLTMVLAVGTVNATRLFPSRLNLVLARFATMGYSVPGAVLAMGVISLFTFLSRVGLPFDASRTTVMLLFAYGVRFFAIGCHAVESGFGKVGNIYREAASTLGAGPAEAFFRVELPLVRDAMLSGFALVFVDVVKELPLTLILRPFNYNTLGTRVYDFARNEILEEMALPALLVIAICAVFVSVAAALDRANKWDSHVKRKDVS
ncbi:MAG: iron ABC transporter permease [Synergistaceae bacterium]|nr:iron ABC transporter permease [Synergistaceae bacterium]